MAKKTKRNKDDQMQPRNQMHLPLWVEICHNASVDDNVVSQC